MITFEDPAVMPATSTVALSLGSVGTAPAIVDYDRLHIQLVRFMNFHEGPPEAH